MATIPQKELRNRSGEVLRRAERGERITITVSGRPVAELGPARRQTWVGAEALRPIWQTPVPRSLEADLQKLPAELSDPFE